MAVPTDGKRQAGMARDPMPTSSHVGLPAMIGPVA
jgi:hypothetical protein